MSCDRLMWLKLHKHITPGFTQRSGYTCPVRGIDKTGLAVVPTVTSSMRG